MDDPRLRSNDKLFFRTLLHIAEQCARRADKFSLLEYGLVALRVRDQRCAGVFRPEPEQFSFAERLMDDTTSLPEKHLPSGFLHKVFPQIPVWGEENRPIFGDLTDDLFGIARCANDIAQRLNLGGAVDIRDGDMVRVHFAERLKTRSGTPLRQRAARVQIRQQHLLSWIQNLRGFSHEMNPREDDDVPIGGGCPA